jgi:MFS family permease
LEISPTRSVVRRLLLAKALRGFGDGFVSLLLPLHLLNLGFTPFEVGCIATATLLGSGLLTLLVGARAARHAWRTLLLAATVLMAGTGLALATVSGFWPLMLVALVGTMPSCRPVSMSANGRRSSPGTAWSGPCRPLSAPWPLAFRRSRPARSEST